MQSTGGPGGCPGVVLLVDHTDRPGATSSATIPPLTSDRQYHPAAPTSLASGLASQLSKTAGFQLQRPVVAYASVSDSPIRAHQLLHPDSLVRQAASFTPRRLLVPCLLSSSKQWIQGGCDRCYYDCMEMDAVVKRPTVV